MPEFHLMAPLSTFLSWSKHCSRLLTLVMGPLAELADLPDVQDVPEAPLTLPDPELPGLLETKGAID